MHLRSLVAVALVAAAVILAPSRTRAEKVCAWSIPSEMVDTVFSGKSKAGQVFKFRVTENTALDDGTPVPEGTLGYGIVRAADSAGRHAHDGMLAIEPRYLEVPSKKKGGAPTRVAVTMNPLLPVTWTPSEPLLNKAASHIPLPVPGLIMTGVNTVRWGRNVTLGPGFTFTVLPVDNLARGPVC